MYLDKFIKPSNSTLPGFDGHLSNLYTANYKYTLVDKRQNNYTTQGL